MLNPIEEAKFTELRDKCRELKVPTPPEIFIGLRVHDDNGVLVFDDKQRGHSWTRNFYNTIFVCATHPVPSGTAFEAGTMTIKSTAAAVKYHAQTYVYVLNSAGGINNPAATNVSGIVVGTGDTAFSANHHQLAAIIESGVASGNLAYTAMAVPIFEYTADTKTWKCTMVRVFNNNSGGSITIKEVGLYSANQVLSSQAINNMVERSVLDPTVAVANGAQLTVTYEISMDFSAID